MSETRSLRIPRRNNTDFSIARILAMNNGDREGEPRLTRAFVALITNQSREDSQQEHQMLAMSTSKHDSPRLSRETHGRGKERERNRRQNDEAEDDISTRNNDELCEGARRVSDNLTWLQYTRYRPPKLPRRSSVERQTKRRAGEHPRVPFSSSQLQLLEDRFKRSAYLSRNDVVEISATLRLSQSKVKIWFQNRRARERRELLNSTA